VLLAQQILDEPFPRGLGWMHRHLAPGALAKVMLVSAHAWVR